MSTKQFNTEYKDNKLDGTISVITIDGPASSGKGTVAKIIAKQLGFHYLESGVIYRVLGQMVINTKTNSDNIEMILRLVDRMSLSFVDGRVLLDNLDVTDELRAEDVGMMASTIAKIPEIRAKLLDFQRGFAKVPGLVTDGRDMGSIVFPNARLKVFLTASAEKRAERRYSQLQGYNNSVTITTILRDILSRDKQDSERAVAPLSYDGTFKVLDNSDMSVDDTVQAVIAWYRVASTK